MHDILVYLLVGVGIIYVLGAILSGINSGYSSRWTSREDKGSFLNLIATIFIILLIIFVLFV